MELKSLKGTCWVLVIVKIFNKFSSIVKDNFIRDILLYGSAFNKYRQLSWVQYYSSGK